MKYRIFIFTLILLNAWILPLNFSFSSDQNPKTLAIFPFENNSVTNPESFNPLAKGLSAMLITDLNKNQGILKVIERDKIQALLKEIALGQTGSVDESTAIRAGKILGAQSIAFGSFMVMGDMIRIDSRIIKVETSELIMAESAMGEVKEFINIERDLAKKIAESLGIALKPQTPSTGSGGGSEKGMDAALLFSEGLNALDQGDKDEADRLFKKCIKLDPSYKDQILNIEVFK